MMQNAKRQSMATEHWLSFGMMVFLFLFVASYSDKFTTESTGEHGGQFESSLCSSLSFVVILYTLLLCDNPRHTVLLHPHQRYLRCP